MATLFISDLHLDPSRPEITDLFHEFLRQRAAKADALYILGDLFEAWIGDDDDAPLARDISSALRWLTEKDVPVNFIHGNRDFLVSTDFATASGARLLSEVSVIDLHGTPTLIMHGDTLCTDDVEYQAFRTQTRSPQWQAAMLAKPLPERRALARHLREGSKDATRQKAEDITDVSPASVVEAMRAHGVRRLIHGHTHRPAVHDLTIDGEPAQRIVLGDWYERGSVLVCDADGCRLEVLPLSPSV